MKLFGKDDFVGSAPRRFESYPCPWDASRGIRVRSLTEPEASDYESRQLKKRKGQVEVDTAALKTARREYIALCLVDQSDRPFLGEEHIREMEGDSRLYAWAYKCCLDHNGIEDSDIEALVKKSPAAGDSASQPPSASTPE